MNTQKDLLIRLLELFQVKAVQEFFGSKKGGAELAEDVIDNHGNKAAEKFSFENTNLTKQHVHIFRLNKKYVYKKISANSFPLTFVKEITMPQNNYRFVCYSTVEFKGILVPQNEDATVKFIQPFLVTLRDKYLIIQATMLEKNIGSYVDNDSKFILLSKKNAEEECILSIKIYFENSYTIEKCDLNKGIKQLWHDDIIDARKTQSKEQFISGLGS